jgi:hypothetical protein
MWSLCPSSAVSPRMSAQTIIRHKRRTISTEVGDIGSEDLGVFCVNDLSSRIHRYRRFISAELQIS